MAEERIVIIVSEQGSKDVAKNVSTIGDSAGKSANSVDILKSALNAFIGGSVLHELESMVDSVTNLRNRFTTLSGSSVIANALLERTGEIANETHTSLETTGDSLVRLATLAKGTGASYSALADVVKTVQQAVQLSGSDTEKAQQTVQQLFSNLERGSLTARNLVSLFRDVPQLAQALEAHFNASGVALKELGVNGEITANQLLKAFQEAGPGIEKAFSARIPTIAESFVTLRNNMLLTVDAVNQTTGASAGLSEVLLALSKHTDVVAVAIGALAVSAIPALITSLRALALVIFANPVLLLAAAVFTLTYAITSTLIKSLKGAKDSTADLLNTTAGLETEWSKSERIIIDQVKALDDQRATLVYNVQQHNILAGVLKSEQEIKKKGLDLDDRQRGILLNAVQELEDAKARVAIFQQVFGGQEKAQNELRALSQLFAEGTISATQFTEAMYKTTTAYGQLTHQLEQTGNVKSQISRIANADDIVAQQNAISRLQQGRDLNEEEKNALITLIDKNEQRKVEINLLDTLNGATDSYMQTVTALDSLLARQRISQTEYNDQLAATKERLFQLQDPMGRVIRDLQKQQALAGLTTRKQSVESQVENDRQTFLETGNQSKFDPNKDRAALNELQQQRDLGAARQEVAGQLDDLAAKEQAYQKLIAEGGPLVDRYRQKLAELRIERLDEQRDLSSGYERGLIKIGQDINDFASSSEKVVTDAFTGMNDALTNFVLTGKLSFSSLVDSILADLTKLLLKMAESALFNSLASSFGGPVGGFFGLLSAGGGKAAGGPVSAGTAYTVGERGPETFVPQNSGVIIPNGGNGATPEVHVHVVNVTDENAVLGQLASSKSDQVIVNKLRQNRQAVKQALGLS